MPSTDQTSNRPPIRVAMVIQNYLPTVGGAERQLASLVPLMLDRGVIPVVYTRSRPGLASEEWIGGAKVVRVPARGPKPLRAVMFILGTLWRLFRAKPDVVHAYDTLAPSFIAGLYRVATKTPYLTKLLRSGHLGDLQRLSERPLGGWRLRLLRSSVDRFVAISRDLEEELASRDIDTDRMVFIPNGVDTNRFAPPEVEFASSEEKWRHRAGLLPDWPTGPVVLIVGRIWPEKRVVELAREWYRVRHQHPDAWLYVVGDGPLESELTGIDGVRLLGKREDVPLLLSWSDLYVSVSSAEGLSNALLEAMAAGCACVVTDVGGVSDVMTHGVDGRIVSPGAPPEAVAKGADEVADLLDTPEIAAELGRTARKTVMANYSIDQTADALVAQYRELAAR